MDAIVATAELDAALRAAGAPERAAMEKRYLKSELVHYGVTVPAIEKTTKSWSKALEPFTHDDLIALAELLWSESVHERRMAAVRLLSWHVDMLIPVDVDLIEMLLRESKTWALVDELSVRVAGPLIGRHPDADAILERWASDDDFWIRRSALLVHLVPLREGSGDFDRFARYADRMLEEKEFFIRKAIGWILRDTSRKRPELVYQWILPRAPRASGVTVREAVKRLPPEQAEQVMTAYRNR